MDYLFRRQALPLWRVLTFGRNAIQFPRLINDGVYDHCPTQNFMATLFFSYSHKDEDLRNELEIQLSILRRQGLIETWHDRRITAGDDLDAAISEKLESADVVLALLSPDFLNSRYCYDIEMKRAFERHQKRECRLIPIILRHCDWQSTPFGKMLVAPTDGKPVKKWPDRDEAFLDVVNHIRNALPPKESTLVTSPEPIPPLFDISTPRSSNLRLRREFTEADKHRFLDEAFSYLRLFFENSLAELQKRNLGVECRFKPIDAQAFGAVIYRNGKMVAQCGLRCGGSSIFNDGISFTNDSNAPANILQHHLKVEADDQTLYMVPWAVSFIPEEFKDSHLTYEGAAEYFWSLFIRSLQGR